jgi:hypothetical protein
MKSAQKQGRRRPHNQGPRRNLLGPTDSRKREILTGGAQARNEAGARKRTYGADGIHELELAGESSRGSKAELTGDRNQLNQKKNETENRPKRSWERSRAKKKK